MDWSERVIWSCHFLLSFEKKSLSFLFFSFSSARKKSCFAKERNSKKKRVDFSWLNLASILDLYFIGGFIFPFFDFLFFFFEFGIKTNKKESESRKRKQIHDVENDLESQVFFLSFLSFFSLKKIFLELLGRYFTSLLEMVFFLFVSFFFCFLTLSFKASTLSVDTMNEKIKTMQVLFDFDYF